MHFSYFNLGGPVGASSHSNSYDAFGDTANTDDYFVEADTFSYIFPAGFMKDRDIESVMEVQPAVCVDSIYVGNSITVDVSFLDSENPPTPQISVKETHLD